MNGRWLLIALAVPALALAAEEQGPYTFGVSGQVVSKAPATETEWLLDQQRTAHQAKDSELSAPLYVDSQRRLADSFRTAIPDTFGEQTRDDN